MHCSTCRVSVTEVHRAKWCFIECFPFSTDCFNEKVGLRLVEMFNVQDRGKKIIQPNKNSKIIHLFHMFS